MANTRNEEYLQAIVADNLEKVKELTAPETINAKLTDKGDRPLRLAFHWGRPRIFQYLLEQNADLVCDRDLFYDVVDALKRAGNAELPYVIGMLEAGILNYATNFSKITHIQHRELSEFICKLRLNEIKKGDAEWYYTLSKLYDEIEYSGKVGYVDYSAKALEYCKAAANKDHKLAINNLVHWYIKNRQFEEALKWLLEIYQRRSIQQIREDVRDIHIARIMELEDHLRVKGSKIEDSKEAPAFAIPLRDLYLRFAEKVMSDCNNSSDHFDKALEFYQRAHAISKRYALPSIPNNIEHMLHTHRREYQLLFAGFKALHGWDRPINAAEAINAFVQVVQEEKTPPRIAKLAQVQVVLCHIHFALEGPISSQSESIVCCEKALDVLLEKFKSHLLDTEIASMQSKLFRLLSASKSEQDTLVVVGMLLRLFRFQALSKRIDRESLSLFFEELIENDSVCQNKRALAKICYELGCGAYNHERIGEVIAMLNSVVQRHQDVAAAHIALGNLYLIMVDKDSLKKCLAHYEKASELDKNFKPSSYRHVYRGMGLRENVPFHDRMSYLLKARDLGDLSSGWFAAELAQSDEKMINTVFSLYEELCKNSDTAFTTLKKMIEWADKCYFFPTQASRFKEIFQSGVMKLNKSGNHYDCETLYALIEKFPCDKRQSLFGDAFKGYLESVKREQVSKDLERRFRYELTADISSLFDFYRQYATDETYYPIFLKFIEKYLKDACDDKEEQDYLEKIIISLHKDKVEHPQAKRLQAAAICFLYEIFTKNEKQYAVELYNLLSFQLYSNSPVLKLSKDEMILTMMRILNIRTVAPSFYTKLLKLNPSLEVKQQLETHLQCAEYRVAVKSGKNEKLEFVKNNNLIALYDLFTDYTAEGVFSLKHVRRPLYLAAKILLLTKDKEKIMKQYGLAPKELDKIINKASEFLNKQTKKVVRDTNSAASALLRPLGSVASKEYQYYQLARWLNTLVDTSDGQDDPDKHMFRHACDKKSAMNLGMNDDDREALQVNIIKGMKEGLKVEDSWIQEKIDAGKAVARAEAEICRKAKAAAVAKPRVLTASVNSDMAPIKQLRNAYPVLDNSNSPAAVTPTVYCRMTAMARAKQLRNAYPIIDNSNSPAAVTLTVHSNMTAAVTPVNNPAIVATATPLLTFGKSFEPSAPEPEGYEDQEMEDQYRHLLTHYRQDFTNLQETKDEPLRPEAVNPDWKKWAQMAQRAAHLAHVAFFKPAKAEEQVAVLLPAAETQEQVAAPVLVSPAAARAPAPVGPAAAPVSAPANPIPADVIVAREATPALEADEIPTARPPVNENISRPVRQRVAVLA